MKIDILRLRRSRKSKSFSLVAASIAGFIHSSSLDRNEVMIPLRVFSLAMDV